MKIKKGKLEELVRSALYEAAKEGRMQNVYRRSYANMIKTVSTGGNKNTPPFTKKAAKPGRSGPISEQNNILLEEYEKALAEGRAGEWVTKNLNKLKPLITTFKEKLASGVEPFTIAVQKWKDGEKLSEVEKKNFTKALVKAGIMLLPGGMILTLIRYLVTNQMGGIA